MVPLALRARHVQCSDVMAEKKHKPPTSANELLERYGAGERDFARAKLQRAQLPGANLSGARLTGAELANANLQGANLIGANLGDATLTRANLRSAALRAAGLRAADLRGADLRDAELHGANLVVTDIGDANFGSAKIGSTNLLRLDLAPLCEAKPPVEHHGPSQIDFKAITLSVRSPNLKDFLQRTGLPEVFVEYMVECAHAMDGSTIKKLLQSTFISYGGPDEKFARKLYEALHRNGVTTFFFPEHARPGQRIGRVVRENVESYDQILLICSEASLDRPGVQFEIEETLERERRGGGAEYLIPVLLDDYLLTKWRPVRADVARTLRDRVCADFRGAQGDEEVFNAGLRRLIAALRPPDLALWRPPGMTKPAAP